MSPCINIYSKLRKWKSSQSVFRKQADFPTVGLSYACAQRRHHTRAKALAEIPPPWQSKVVIIKLCTCIKIFWLPLLMRLMTCLCPAMNGELVPPLLVCCVRNAVMSSIFVLLYALLLDPWLSVICCFHRKRALMQNSGTDRDGCASLVSEAVNISPFIYPLFHGFITRWCPMHTWLLLSTRVCLYQFLSECILPRYIISLRYHDNSSTKISSTMIFLAELEAGVMKEYYINRSWINASNSS